MKKLVYIGLGALFACAILSSFRKEIPGGGPISGNDSTGSVKAFLAAYKVLMSPRCMNCHPAGDAPLQGDDGHVHMMNITRGKDGKGVYAAKCNNCHQRENTAGLHAPPGSPKWGLPPANMRMVFQGRSPRQLALQLLDPKQNGGRTKQQLIDHMANDDLVGWAWNPGEGRTLPPMSRSDFARQVRIWIATGAYIPGANKK